MSAHPRRVCCLLMAACLLSLPALALAGPAPVAVLNQPSVNVPNGVAVTNTPTVNVGNTPSVNIANRPAVSVPDGVQVTNADPIPVKGKDTRVQTWDVSLGAWQVTTFSPLVENLDGYKDARCLIIVTGGNLQGGYFEVRPTEWWADQSSTSNVEVGKLRVQQGSGDSQPTIAANTLLDGQNIQAWSNMIIGGFRVPIYHPRALGFYVNNGTSTTFTVRLSVYLVE